MKRAPYVVAALAAVALLAACDGGVTTPDRSAMDGYIRGSEADTTALENGGMAGSGGRSGGMGGSGGRIAETTTVDGGEAIGGGGTAGSGGREDGGGTGGSGGRSGGMGGSGG